ncbi:MAG: MFS transporter [Mailhella sp.]|nr:MFS transporter [Mailhella sp.]
MTPSTSSLSRKQVIIFALITAACVAGDSMLYVVLPVHWESAGLTSLWEVGLLLSLNRLARLPLNPFAGWVYSRLSTKTCSVFASLLAVLVTLSYGLVEGLAAWAVLRVLWGLSWSFLKLGGLFTVMDVAGPNERGYLVGLYSGIYRLGSLAGMLGGGLIADLFGLKVTALVCAAIAMPAVIMSLTMLKHTPPEKRRSATEQEGRKTSVLSVLRSPKILWVLLTCLMVKLISEGFFMSTLSPLLEHHWGSTISCFGLALGCATVAGFIQSLRWGWDPVLSPLVGRISDGRLGRVSMFAGGCWACAALLALTVFKMPFWPWMGLLIGFLICCTVMTTLSDALATDVASESQAVVVITAYTFAIDLGAALGPMGGFAAIELWGMDAAYLIGAVLMAIFALQWTFWPPVKRSQN